MLERARALIGVRFRLHGRDCRHGLDCVGLVALALDRVEAVPRGYGLRMSDADRARRWARSAGLVPGTGVPGEVMLMRTAATQLHLGVATETGGLVHADAGLGRVVERPGPLPWPVLARWHVKEGDGAWRR